MTTLAVDNDGNLLYNDTGFVVLTGDEALAQDIRTSLRLHRGEYPFNPDVGVNYANFMKTNNRDILIDYIKSVVKSDPRVSRFNVNLELVNKKLTVNINIYTKWGTKVNV